MCLKFHVNDTLVRTGVIQGHNLALQSANFLYDNVEETAHVLY